MKRKVVNADEYDVVSKWRHVLCYLDRAGAASTIKRRMRRRERHDARRKLGRED